MDNVVRPLLLSARRGCMDEAGAPRVGLASSAVFFKSGSLYECKKEPGFSCASYAGNAKNFMEVATRLQKLVESLHAAPAAAAAPGGAPRP